MKKAERGKWKKYWQSLGIPLRSTDYNNQCSNHWATITRQTATLHNPLYTAPRVVLNASVTHLLYMCCDRHNCFHFPLSAWFIEFNKAAICMYVCMYSICMYAYVVEYSQVHVIAASLYIHNSFMTSFKVSVKDLHYT